MMFRLKFTTLLALPVALVFIHCGNAPQTDEDTLAVIGDRLISKDDFVERYAEFRQRTGDGVPDTYLTRRQVLSTMIDEEILIAEAKRQELHEERAARLERERIEMQQLLNAFAREFIAENVKVDDDELRQLFIRLNTKIKARHLYAPTKEAADSLHASLQNGASFDKLAQDVFQDPELRESGGSLGYFKVDEMEPRFEEAAFALNPGELSEPVKTRDGYSIIMVEDRVTKPLLTEMEYAKHKHKLYAYWRNRKIKRAMEAFADSMGKQLKVVFNEPVLKELYAKFETDNDDVREESQLNWDIGDLKHEVLVRSELGSWTVAMFRHKATFTTAGQRQAIRDEARFKEFITGLVVRDYMLQRAREAELDQTEKFNQKVAEEWNTYLYGRMEAYLKEQMPVPSDSVRSYFERNKDLFATPARVNLREIVLNDSLTANEIGEKLRAGAVFADLAQQYSERRWSAERGGELGFLTRNDLGMWGPQIFEMQVGEIAGPLKMDSKFVFLQCLQKLPGKPRSFEQAREDVEDAVRFALWSDYRNSKLDEFQKSLEHIKSYPEKLKHIRIN